MVLDDNLTRQEMFNHPLYVAQNLLGQYNMFMSNVAFTENSRIKDCAICCSWGIRENRYY